MSLLLVLLLDSLPVAAGQALVDRLHTYDVLEMEVVAEPAAAGLRVECRLTVVPERPGPLRFLLSAAVGDLAVTRDGERVPFSFGAGGLEKVLDVAAPAPGMIPYLLTLEPPEPLAPGTEATFELSYTWRPRPGGWFRADAHDVETHLSGFWLPSMADELFRARVRVRTAATVVAPGQARRTADGWLFEPADPVQVVPLVVGSFVRFAGEDCEVLVARDVTADGEAIARDLARVLRALESWFGRAPGGPFRLLVVPPRDAPSYCGGDFAVVDVRWTGAGREAWLAHLAHECAHRWIGHRLCTPVIGRGGTWIREGLAEWAGIEVAGVLLGAATGAALWRDRFARYVGRADLRRTEEAMLFANEPTLVDATYLDDPAVAYLRGALVFRLLAHEAGAAEFRARVRAVLESHAFRLTGAEEFLDAVGGLAAARFYAATTRLPDLRLEDVAAEEGALRGRLRCADADWPGGRVPVRVETAAGVQAVEVRVRAGEGELRWAGEGRPVRVELDPERLYLDPVRSNSVWPR